MFFNIDKLLLTPKGKLDKGALPQLDLQKNKEEFRIAEDGTQELLENIFQDVLNFKQIGIDDNFFEMDGDSIKAVQITSRLYDIEISLNVKDILTYQTNFKLVFVLNRYKKSNIRE